MGELLDGIHSTLASNDLTFPILQFAAKQQFLTPIIATRRRYVRMEYGQQWETRTDTHTQRRTNEFRKIYTIVKVCFARFAVYFCNAETI